MYEHNILGLWVSMTFDLKINVGLCDLYFMDQWFCLISPSLYDAWVIFSDNKTVWCKLQPQSKYKSTWPIFHGLVFLLNIFKIIWWMTTIVGIMDQCDTMPSKCRSVTYILWFSDFASCLEDYLMEKCCSWDNGSVWLDRPCKIYVGQWPIFHDPSILPYIIVIDLNYFYTLWNGTGRGYSCPSGHLL